ncbi:hypothetical protein MH215_03520 [Paenibacillus sp. ACRSA]|uniref:hypothetical protein n=1 Tax=Paenibacillus sp. ACRSA TaxID=2918211 RepID=UPI001EF3FD25|nr:hypothetical protein [Paenibacillus sp. ACRSA]MCG7376048.1 hypothetical protein [Paenibacillus sp. ACRSA]
MNNLIMKHWSAEQRELPGLNCIVFPNGNIIMLNVETYYDPNNNERSIYCSPLCDTTIESVGKYNADCWTIVDPWTSIDYQDGKIYGGDGQMGNEGFIACTDADDNMVWGIFLDVTNPIKQLGIQDTILTAINEHEDMRIEISLHNLVDIQMSYLR